MFLQVKPSFINNGYTLVETNSCLAICLRRTRGHKSISLWHGDSKFRTGEQFFGKMALALKLSEERILQAYKYWQKLV